MANRLRAETLNPISGDFRPRHVGTRYPPLHPVHFRGWRQTSGLSHDLRQNPTHPFLFQGAHGSMTPVSVRLAPPVR